MGELARERLRGQAQCDRASLQRYTGSLSKPCYRHAYVSLAAREAQLEQEQAKLEAARAEAPKGRKTFLNNNDPDFVNPKEKLYDKFPLTVHQMDIIIGVLFALIVLFLVLGFTHTSFFGLFGG